MIHAMTATQIAVQRDDAERSDDRRQERNADGDHEDDADRATDERPTASLAGLVPPAEA